MKLNYVYYKYIYTYYCILMYGGFHKWGTPQNGWFITENPIQMDDVDHIDIATSPYNMLVIHPHLRPSCHVWDPQNLSLLNPEVS